MPGPTDIARRSGDAPTPSLNEGRRDHGAGRYFDWFSDPDGYLWKVTTAA